MKQYMLDTNTVSHLLREHPAVVKHLLAHPIASLCISAITEGELLFGLAKRPQATRLAAAVRALLSRVDTLPWGNGPAEHYSKLRSSLEQRGQVLAPLDMLIAAHAISVNAVLVTNDQAFTHATELQVKDWTISDEHGEDQY